VSALFLVILGVVEQASQHSVAYGFYPISSIIRYDASVWRCKVHSVLFYYGSVKVFLRNPFYSL